MRIYLDHNATTPIHPQVANTMAEVLREHFGNASSVHTFGQTAKAYIDEARTSLAKLLDARPQEIVFTSGGTESNNLAIRGIAESLTSTNRRHIITSGIEHEAILNTCKFLGKQGWKISILPIDRSGVIDPASLETTITDDTAMVSIMHANNEIGTIQPINKLATIAHSVGAVFHTDAVQSVGKIPVAVDNLNIDLLSLSAHKFNGPKGVGALWIRRGVKLVANTTGGRQERNRRAGTENVAGIVGLGIAAQLATQNMPAKKISVAQLRDRLEAGILQHVAGTIVNGNCDARVPNTTNISFDRIEAESLLIALDLEGIAISTGSACSSGTLEPSHVLRAMGFSPHRTQNSIRFSLGENNTESDVDRVLNVLPLVVNKLRSLSRSNERVHAS